MSKILSKANVRTIQSQTSFKVEGKKLQNSDMYIATSKMVYLLKTAQNKLDLTASVTLNFSDFKAICEVNEVLTSGEDFEDACEFFSVNASKIEAVYTLSIREIA